MTRPYPHRPEVERAAQRYERAVDMLERARDHSVRGAGFDDDRVRMALDHVWDALAWGWLVERPPTELEAVTVRAVEMLHAGLDVAPGRPLRPHDVEQLVATALLAGDVDAAVRVAARELPPPSGGTDWRAAALAALVRGDDVPAGTAAARLRAVVVDPTTAPGVAGWLEHVDTVVEAVLRRDQAAFDAALAARAQVVARLHRTARMQRRWTGLLDRDAIAIARVAEQRGLVVPSGVPVVPAELLAAVGSAAARAVALPSPAPPSPARVRWWRRRGARRT